MNGRDDKGCIVPFGLESVNISETTPLKVSLGKDQSIEIELDPETHRIWTSGCQVIIEPKPKAKAAS